MCFVINSERYIYTFERIGRNSQAAASYKLNPRRRACSLTDNLYPDCSDICLHLFFSPVVSAPQRNSRSWLTWLILWVSSSCSMWCTATHPRTQRTGWTALTALTPVSSTAGPVENTASGTADSSTTLGETQVCFSHFKHPKLHVSYTALSSYNTFCNTALCNTTQALL